MKTLFLLSALALLSVNNAQAQDDFARKSARNYERDVEDEFGRFGSRYFYGTYSKPGDNFFQPKWDNSLATSTLSEMNRQTTVRDGFGVAFGGTVALTDVGMGPDNLKPAVIMGGSASYFRFEKPLALDDALGLFTGWVSAGPQFIYKPVRLIRLSIYGRFGYGYSIGESYGYVPHSYVDNHNRTWEGGDEASFVVKGAGFVKSFGASFSFSKLSIGLEWVGQSVDIDPGESSYSTNYSTSNGTSTETESHSSKMTGTVSLNHLALKAGFEF